MSRKRWPLSHTQAGNSIALLSGIGNDLSSTIAATAVNVFLAAMSHTTTAKTSLQLWHTAGHSACLPHWLPILVSIWMMDRHPHSNSVFHFGSNTNAVKLSQQQWTIPGLIPLVDFMFFPRYEEIQYWNRIQNTLKLMLYWVNPKRKVSTACPYQKQHYTVPK